MSWLRIAASISERARSMRPPPFYPPPPPPLSLVTSRASDPRITRSRHTRSRRITLPRHTQDHAVTSHAGSRSHVTEHYTPAGSAIIASPPPPPPAPAPGPPSSSSSSIPIMPKAGGALAGVG
eukprot:445492-Rhodomonas_salina.1